MNKIYVLHVGQTDIYVGTTSGTLKTRLRQHISEATNGGESKKCQLIRALIEDGDTVEIRLLEETEDGDAEYLWVEKYELQGITLANSKSGNKGSAINEANLRKEIQHVLSTGKKRLKAAKMPHIQHDFTTEERAIESKRVRELYAADRDEFDSQAKQWKSMCSNWDTDRDEYDRLASLWRDQYYCKGKE
jgi:hypothetical protein